ncbi:MAG TPA: fumarylacetoacetate hydrolase [Burkholderiaceae bacterium]|nr:fumarylacetoacetate hydrolase [Burkholderiaceae bacterium]
MRRHAPALLGLAAALALAGCSSVPLDPATCPSDAQAAATARRFVALEPEPNPPSTMTMEGAVCARDKLVRALGASQGRVVGYKAGLTNAAVQKRFGHDAPVRGTLFERMIVADGAEVPAKFGARPLFEADLVVEVASSAIHDAKTPLQVLGALRSIRPFIELPDLVVQDPTKLGGVGITAINVGARLGVLGAPIPVSSADPRLADALRDMTVRLVDGSGKELDSGRGSAILEHPLNAVIWLAEDLRRSGVVLKPGDLLSLGSFSRLLPPQPGTTVRAVYEGLPGNPSVSVRFR